MGVSGTDRLIPTTCSTSVVSPANGIAARHFIEPHRQGQLDGCCGIYSAINGLRLALHDHNPLTKAAAKRLFEMSADFLDDRGGAGEAMWAGMETRRWHALVRKLAKHIPTASLVVEVERPEFTSKPGLDMVFEWIAASLAQGKPVLVHLDGTLKHFSVISGSTPTRLELFDSNCHRFVMRSSCGVRTGFHILRPKALLRLAVRPR